MVNSERIALGIPHTPWRPDRVESMARLRQALAPMPVAPYNYREFTEREPNDVWSERLWGWAVTRDTATWLVTLQDDALVCRHFWHRLAELLDAGEHLCADIVNLQAVHPAARDLFEAGERWYTCTDQVVGVGYAIRIMCLAQFLDWRRERLRDGWRTAKAGTTAIDEDTCLGLFAMATARKIYAPLPTVIDHDVSVESTYGNTHHKGRRPPVTLCGVGVPIVDWGCGSAVPPHLGRVYGQGVVQLARRWVRGWSEADHTRVMRDDGSQDLRKLVIRQELEELEGPRTSVYVATRTRGRPHPEYFATLWRMIRASRVDLTHGWDVFGVRGTTEDLVRTTSRMMREFLESSCDALWVLDDDVSVEPRALLGMIRTGRDFVACPYPQRDDSGQYRLFIDPEIEPILADPQKLLEALEGGDGTLPVNGMGLGCALIRRPALERMVAYYLEEPVPEGALGAIVQGVGPDPTKVAREAYELGRRHGHRLPILDVVDGDAYLTVAMSLLLVDNYRLLSEDLSFFARARRAGLEPRVYLGPGSPVNHHGDRTWTGSIAHFGLERTTAAPERPAPLADGESEP